MRSLAGIEKAVRRLRHRRGGDVSYVVLDATGAHDGTGRAYDAAGLEALAERGTLILIERTDGANALPVQAPVGTVVVKRLSSSAGWDEL